MAFIADIVPPDGVLLHLKAYSLESAIEQISASASEITGARAPVIAQALLARARLNASVGGGVIIPHARIAGVHRVYGFFARPLIPIVYDSGAPIALIFALLAPEGADAAHLQALARIAGVLRDPAARAQLETGDRDDVLAVLAAA
ncbi:MAG: PTS sugar transporter subunit IIA [Pseudomonadota bacterium]